ncbi:Dual-specificity RNA methyltransferase RlmN, partial [Bienertia sinuspersici]
GKLKGLHAEDIQATVRSAKEKLEDCQNQLHKDPHNKDLIHKEYQANKQVMKVGDSNSKVFFNSLKVRTSRNTINRLMDNQGRWVEDMETGLEIFSLSTGLEISAAKSELNCAGVATEMINRIKELSGFKMGKQRLLTRDRLVRMKLTNEDNCCLCSRGVDSHSHVFFEYEFSRACLKQILDWVKLRMHHCQLHNIVQWLARNCKGDKLRRQAYCAAINVLVYFVWKARNDLIWINRLWKADQ